MRDVFGEGILPLEHVTASARRLLGAAALAPALIDADTQLEAHRLHGT